MERPAAIRKNVGYAAIANNRSAELQTKGAGHEEDTIYWNGCPWRNDRNTGAPHEQKACNIEGMKESSRHFPHPFEALSWFLYQLDLVCDTTGSLFHAPYPPLSEHFVVRWDLLTKALLPDER